MFDPETHTTKDSPEQSDSESSALALGLGLGPGAPSRLLSGPAGDATSTTSAHVQHGRDLQATSVVAEERSRPVGVKSEPVDLSSDDSDTESQGTADGAREDVIYIDQEMKETTVKYLQGEISFDEYSALLVEQVKVEPADEYPDIGVVEEVVSMETSTTVDDQVCEPCTSSAPDASTPSTSKKGRKCKFKPHPKLPRHLQGLMGEANMKFARGETDEAIKMCMEVVRLAPRAPEPFQTLGLIYDELGDSSKALQFSLIGAHLHPNEPEEWVRLAELSLEQNNVAQAIKCYDKGIKYDPQNVSMWWARCELQESTGERKKALEGYQRILTFLPDSSRDKFFQASREMTKICYASGDAEKALASLQKAFELHPTQVTAEDVNLLLELMISQRIYDQPIEVLVQHCGIKIQYSDGVELASSPDGAPVKLPSKTPSTCVVSEDLPVDLRSKLAVCVIHLKWIRLAHEVLGPLLAENPDDVGDLYLDVAEALMETGHNREAEPILSKLVKSSVYNLAAVWLRYAECLNSLGELQKAVNAYQKVVQLAPSHLAARVSLSALQQQLGRHEEALEALEQEKSVSTDEKQQPKLDLRLMLPKCFLLYSQKKYIEFIECSKQVLFSHFKDIFERKHLAVILSNRSLKHRLAALRSILGSKFENSIKMAMNILEESSVTTEDLWELYLKVCDVMVELKRFQELQDFSTLALTSPQFMSDPDKAADADFICMLACLLNGDGKFAYSFVRELCVKNMNANQVWNFFGQVMALSQDIRHNRFCLRLMVKNQEHHALGILNGHNAMVAGSYKHALGEYVAAFRQNPQDPLISLCIGLTFIHMASQKFASKRHALTIQGCAFLNQYLELRGECQESYYNLGRAMHQLGLLHVAVYYYEEALKFAPAIVDDDTEIFDLSREIAFNLQLIYQNSGSKELAALVTQKYLVI